MHFILFMLQIWDTKFTSSSKQSKQTAVLPFVGWISNAFLLRNTLFFKRDLGWDVADAPAPASKISPKPWWDEPSRRLAQNAQVSKGLLLVVISYIVFGKWTSEGNTKTMNLAKSETKGSMFVNVFSQNILKKKASLCVPSRQWVQSRSWDPGHEATTAVFLSLWKNGYGYTQGWGVSYLR